MTTESIFDRAEAAATAVRQALELVPEVGIVLGSGLGGLVDSLAASRLIACAAIPHFPVPTVPGHAGRLVGGTLAGVPTVMLQGRFHGYEGHDPEVVTFPIRVLQRLGVRTLILTAATGGIRADLAPGQLVCLSDHLNLQGINPLRGANDERFGPRFPDMTAVYSPRLRALARDEASRQGLALTEGVYAALPGPSYETPAEIRMLRTLGADVVGMSTVPEAIVARHGGLEVIGFALVTNAAAGVTGAPIDHAEVLAEGLEAGQRLARIIAGVVARLAGPAAG